MRDSIEKVTTKIKIRRKKLVDRDWIITTL